MTRFTQILIQRARKTSKYFRNPTKYARLIKKEAAKILTDPRVYLFGSVITGDAVPSSDIDILVVAPDAPLQSAKNAQIKVQLYKKVGDNAPFEIHLVNPTGFAWYEKFIEKKIQV